MKKLAILALLSLAACGDKHVETIPKPPENTEVVQNDVPIPVLCTVEIAKAEIAIDKAERGLKLEQQNAMLRQTIAEQKAYIKSLEAGIIGCGGKVK
jgi:hypothetical protein